jgi:hypothetical protein
MQEFEDCCISFFENKDIPEDKQVWKILAGLKDTQVRNWVMTQKDTLIASTFMQFMMAFWKVYLSADWDESVRCELGGMSQGTDSFWNFAMCIQSLNSLLHGTLSHLDKDKLHH